MNTATIAQRSLSAVVWNYAGAILRALAQLGAQVVLARVLGPQVYGQFAVVLVVISFGWLLAESGMGAALIQMPELDDDAIRQAIGGVLLQGGLVGLAIIFAAPFLARLFEDPTLTVPLMVCGPLVVVQGLCNIPASLMRRNFDMKRWQIIQVGAYAFSFGVVGITLALAGWGLWSLIVAFALQTAIAITAAYLAVRHPLRPSFRMSPHLRSYGAKVLGSAVASWTVDNLDRAVVGRVWGVASLGAYSAAFNLARAPATLLSHSVQSVSLAMASRLQEDPARLCLGYCAVTAGLSMVLLPVFSLLAVAAEPVVLLLYGHRWTEAAPMFAAFALTMPFYILAANTASFMWATGSVGKELISQVLVAAMLVTGFVVMGAMPLSWAVWLVPTAHLLRAALIYRLLARRIGLSHLRMLRAVAGGAALAVLGVLSWYGMRFVVPASEHAFAPMLQLAAAGAVVALAVLVTRGRLVPEDLRSALKGRLPASRAGRMAGHVLGL
nr:lipopolysaccharide biosynthesis protein [uncultured Caldimonas sp.]